MGADTGHVAIAGVGKRYDSGDGVLDTSTLVPEYSVTKFPS